MSTAGTAQDVGDTMRERVFAATAELATAADDETLQPLVERVLEHVATEDLIEREPRDLVGAVAALRDLAATRAPGQTLVRVLSPSLRENGWTSRRTVVQICTDDSPFLVDSVTAGVAQDGLAVHLIVHPLLVVHRSADGVLEQVSDERPPTASGVTESWMHLEVDRLSSAAAESALATHLGEVLDDVRAAVEDWLPIKAACEQIVRDLDAGVPTTVDAAAVQPTQEFLEWLADDHFTFVGYREYLLDEVDVEGRAELALRPVEGSGLGILRVPDGAYTRLRPEAQRTAREPRLLTITKANSRSTVHRPVYLDYIGIRTFDADGAVTGEKRFLGLFTSTAYAESVFRLPIASAKAAEVLRRSGFAASSHSGKDLSQILEAYPRDELFAVDIDRLTETVQEVAYLAERRRPKLFVRKDEYGRFASALVFVPRDRYTTAVRLRIEAMLREAFHAEHVDYTTRLSDSPLAQLHFVVRSGAGKSVPDVDVAVLQDRVLAAIRTWDEELADALHAGAEEEAEDHANELLATYGFPEAYKEDIAPADAVGDLARLGELATSGGSVHLAPGEGPDRRRFKVFSSKPLSLTKVLPVLTDLGVEVVDERPYSITTPTGLLGDDPDQGDLHIYDFGLRASPEIWDVDGAAFEEAFTAIWGGAAESDALNSLVLTAELSWRQIVVLRAIGRYLRQIGSAFSMEYIEEALVANPRLAAGVVRLFETRFDPDRPGSQTEREEDAAAQVEKLLHALDDVASLDADRILRSFIGIVRATLRTNFFQTAEEEQGSHKPYVSMKLDCRRVPNLPQPHPMAEIWVYAPSVEGVHLRFGRVARGGLRWSDRREDFRTEVLGLVKAQMVKNAVIVPTGSKGGFVGKQLPDPTVDRGAWVEAGKEAYRTFIRGLLDLTDNRVGGEVVPPERVVRHDVDDPYLVVAADKGTASFSDIANGISREYGFWLDDAFASGGSAGYDHKGMGITARGAWESVKRHFRELGVNTQEEDFTVVGIGDMSGDVFGNGMLLSEHIRLVAAFDHRHVFVDPNPDAATGFAERKRLFELPGSSWADYDTSLISEGGGVHPRSAKSVAITPQVAEALGIEADVQELTPAELIRRVLLAPVDLLWNGGIGTYVKASTETDADVGDRANDAIRVNGGDLRVRVVGEGGNLGATQRGRIEAALAGVQINTDAIDNSAGVGTSDKEVNIKILLADPVRSGELTLDERNELLASMTDEVATQVLRDNYEQNVLLGNSRANSAVMLPVHSRLISWLEERGDLDRELEHLPGDAEIARRIEAGEGLTRPEFAVVLAYAKLALKADLAATELADEPWFARTLAAYFPEAVRERFPEALAAHPLRTEIIVNSVVNSMVNRGGITFAFRAADETGGSVEQIARAYVTSREIYGLRSFVSGVEETDNVAPTLVQTDLYLTFRRLLDRASRWFVLNRPDMVDVAAEVERFAGHVQTWTYRMGELLQGDDAARHRARVAELQEAGFPAEFAERGAALLASLSLLDIVATAGDDPARVEEVAKVYYALSPEIGFNFLMQQVNDLPQDDRWDSMARASMRDDLSSVLIALTRSVLAATSSEASAKERIASWAKAGGTSTTRALDALASVHAVEDPGLATLSVAVRTLRTLAG
ncbi:NAD-glutamate dehydrogenase [Pseudactinotalea terrae]|uniref:NAD-glutamate dehydrogenase n=1 Tax=Pseudactinotalea terrae TaxID=1743262 RepID=UPI001F4F9E42|nr:NAD-glutamate dehydrogenase [Pseudactinotalea terrae]